MGDLLSIEEVLAAEADAIHGQNWRAGLEPPKGQHAHDERTRLNADDRSRPVLDENEVKRRREFYRGLNKLNRAALCCSGGGIRSATFCLGVIQALAAHAAPRPPGPRNTQAAASPPSNAAPARSAAAAQKPANKLAATAEDSLLGRIHYLSTVSGGGYVGSWLSSWRMRDDFPTVFQNLTGRPRGADVESPEISWLRAYSNYLTPRVGIASADSWAAVAIFARNLVLNWLIIIPVVCLVLLLLKFVVAVSAWAAHTVDNGWIALSAGLGAILLVVAQRFTTRHRPACRQPRSAHATATVGNVNEAAFLRRDLIWAVFSAIGVTVFFTSRYFSSLVDAKWVGLSVLESIDLGVRTEVIALTALAGLVVFAIGWIAGRPARSSTRDFICWAASGLVYGALVGLGAELFLRLQPYAGSPPGLGKSSPLLLAVIFGVPWVLMAQQVAETIFVGLVSYEKNSDSDREWLGRAAGWLVAIAVAWAVMAFLVFAGGYFVQEATVRLKGVIVTSGTIVGVISALLTALLGGSSKTPAKATSDDQKDPMAIALNIGLAIAGPLFAAILIVALSTALDRLLLGNSLIRLLREPAPSLVAMLPWLGIGLVGAFVVAAIASSCVNINRFSLHALYRNRLIRAYLGASRQERHPDLFTGFDADDNVRVHELWPPKSGHGMNTKNLFHVINIALNVVLTKRLAWQQRKAEAFTVSPLHCGSAYMGFRRSDEYGDGRDKNKQPGEAKRRNEAKNEETGDRKFGIALGTAMAISGAAVSPNMGYHSSPSITLLLTLLNVRLGWWLGNPGKAGEQTYQSEGPKRAVVPLVDEAFGQTTDENPYVYLSDGGHFENLGLYEMVRRRCRLIIVVDAGCDPDFAFEDLGNAVRKIYIDLGVRIQFEKLEQLKNHPSTEEITQVAGGTIKIPYCALGTVHYDDADGCSSDDNGRILYVKPAYHGSEGAGIRSYATANPSFPHESTADQWFTESQFESYRSLGLEVVNHMFMEQEVQDILDAFVAGQTIPA